MGIFSILKSKKRDFSRKKSGSTVSYTMQSQRNGLIVISVKSTLTPDGKDGVTFSCFNSFVGKFGMTILEESDFISDIKSFLTMLDNSSSTDNSYYNKVITEALQKHQQTFGRIIDTDLYTIEAELWLLLENDLKNKIKRIDFLDAVLTCAEQRFSNSLFIAQYVRTPHGIMPQLIKFTDIKK